MQTKNLFRKILALSLAGTMLIGLTACSGKENKMGEAEESGGRTVIYYAASNVNANVRDAYLKLVETYNKGQGVTCLLYTSPSPRDS